MKLTEQEKQMGLVVVTCKCCGEVHKAHKMQNSCAYSLTPNYGCDKCQGISEETGQQLAFANKINGG